VRPVSGVQEERDPFGPECRSLLCLRNASCCARGYIMFMMYLDYRA
jgi:hypothetical protein